MKHIMVWGVVGLVLVIGSSIAADKETTSAVPGKAGRPAKPVDVASKMVEIEVLIVGTKSPDGHRDDRIDFDIATEREKTVARVLELEKQGKLDVVTRIRLTTLDEQAAFIRVGERRPVVTARNYSGRAGGATRAAGSSYTYENVGTILGMTPRVVDDDVALELDIEKSRLAESQTAAGGQKDDDAVLPPRVDTSSCQATIRVASGETVLVGGLQSQSNQGDSMFLVLATARIVPDR